MRHIRLRTTATLLCLYCATMAYAQQPQPAASVPRLVRFSGSFRPADGTASQTMESVTLSVYRDQAGGAALWHEIQNVVVDPDGHYSALMGATQNDGMPLDLFTSGEPRWLGTQFNRPGEAEQPRVLLVSVPYALKSADADTLGGKPASAYLLAAPTVGTDTARETTSTTIAVKPKATPANNGQPNYIGMFANTTDLIDSAIYEVNGNVGISTTAPLISLDVRTGALPQMGIAGMSDYLTFFASDQYGPAIYWDPLKDMRFGQGGEVGLYNPYGFVEQMRIQRATGNVGIGTMTPSSKLDVMGDINLSGTIEELLPSFRYQGNAVLKFPGGSDFNNIALGIGAFGSGAEPGADNTVIGGLALGRNSFGSYNTANGYQALMNNTTGNNNIGIGYQAALNVSGGNSNNIHIGSQGSAFDSGVIRIGYSVNQSAFFAAGIRGATTGNNDAIPVMVDSAGQLGTVSSSRRFKEDISDMGVASHDLMRLRPVTYRYKQPFADGSKPIQYGLIAEEVAEVYPDLVAHSADGQIETVKYQVLDSMLLNEVQRQQAEIGAQKAQIRQLGEQLAQLRSQLEAVLASISNGSHL